MEEINNKKIRIKGEIVKRGVEKNRTWTIGSKGKNKNIAERYLLILEFWQYNNCPNYLNLATILIWY